jgi:hypothetical protein
LFRTRETVETETLAFFAISLIDGFMYDPSLKSV